MKKLLTITGLALLAITAGSQPTNQRILGVWVASAHEFPIAAYGALCNASNDDTAAVSAAVTAAISAGGGMVTGSGTCLISSPIVINSPRVVFSSKHHGDGDHDTGSNDNGWVLRWNGSSGSVMVTMSAVAGASNQALVGNGARGITFDCANTAGTGLLLKSVKGGWWDGMYFLECTTAGLDMLPVGASGSLGDAPDVQYNSFRSVRVRTVLSTGIGIRMGGQSGTANTSFDAFYDTQILYKNGKGMQLQDTDNLRFFGVQMVRASGGSGIGVEITGDNSASSRSDFFYDLSPGAGGVTIRGTETVTNAVQNIQFLGYDITNNPPAPTLGTGVTGITIYKENGHQSGAGMVNGFFGETDSSLTNAFTNCSTADSICEYNGSQSGIRILDGTGTWLFRQDASHNLNLVRVAGSGIFTMVGSGIIFPSFTVATLPTCNSGSKGEIVVATDTTSPTYNGTLTGSGSVVVPVFCNGSAWTSH